MKPARDRYGLHACPMNGCRQPIPFSHIACSTHWEMVPRWLRAQIAEQLRYGRAWKCHPTQKYLDLRSQAVKIVNGISAERFARPAPTQPPLFV